MLRHRAASGLGLFMVLAVPVRPEQDLFPTVPNVLALRAGHPVPRAMVMAQGSWRSTRGEPSA